MPSLCLPYVELNKRIVCTNRRTMDFIRHMRRSAFFQAGLAVHPPLLVGILRFGGVHHGEWWTLFLAFFDVAYKGAIKEEKKKRMFGVSQHMYGARSYK